jgi:hypothetical protein
LSSFIVGSLLYDHNKLGFKSESCLTNPKAYCYLTHELGNSNRGHNPSMYGGELRENEKMELIEFLKVLTPELEYSWKSVPMYKIENNECRLR